MEQDTATLTAKTWSPRVGRQEENQPGGVFCAWVVSTCVFCAAASTCDTGKLFSSWGLSSSACKGSSCLCPKLKAMSLLLHMSTRGRSGPGPGITNALVVWWDRKLKPMAKPKYVFVFLR